MSGGGGGKGGGSSMKSKDVRQILGQQQGYDLENAYRQAALNNTNQTTPFGTINYSPTPGAALYNGMPTQYTATTSLSPEQQGLYNQSTGLQGSALGLAGRSLSAPGLSQPFDLSGLGAVPGMDTSGGRDALTDAIMKRMSPDIEADRARNETRLANQGITAGSEAFNDANRRLEQNINDQRTSAYITGAGEEQNRQLQSRQQMINEMLLGRNQPIQEAQQLYGMYSGQYPQAVGGTQTGIQTPDVGSIYGMMKPQQGDPNATMNNLFGLGGALGSAALLGFSDRRLKSDVERIGTVRIRGGEVPFYRYTMFGRPASGVMADEVEVVNPEAVSTIDAYQVVDYGRLFS